MKLALTISKHAKVKIRRRRSRSHFADRASHPLALYRQAFTSRADRSTKTERNEIKIRIQPNDEIAFLTIHLPTLAASEHDVETEILTLAGGSTLSAVEITDLRTMTDGVKIRIILDATGARFVASGLQDLRPGEPLHFSFNAWEACSPAEGIAPYLHSTLTAHISVPYRPNLPLLLTLVTPASSTPRSTQGTHTLAYPSRTFAAERQTNIYYQNSRHVRLAYRFGTTSRLTDPWVSLGRAAISAAFIFLIAIVSEEIAPKDRFTALIAAFIAIATVLWDFIHEIAQFQIYDAYRTRIHLFVLNLQALVIASLVITVLITTTKWPLPQYIATFASGAVAILTTLAALVGLTLHARGWWHGYQCDHEGCTTLLRFRRSTPECHYTGRVYCSFHIEASCTWCVHGDDLLYRTLHSSASFGLADTPCGIQGTTSDGTT